MKKLLRSLASVAVVVASGAFVMGLAGSASAAGGPPWEPIGNPPEVGSLLFYNTAGQQITGGSLTAQPLAAYVKGTATVRAGDTKATLFGYLPVLGQTPGEWSGEALSASTTYPPPAPPNLHSSTLPIVTGGSTDETVATLEADFPNLDTSPTDGYANMYVLRLRTSAAGTAETTSYDSADIVVNNTAGTVNGVPADSWSVFYPVPTMTATTTTLTTVPSSPQVLGTSVALTATVSPSAPGTVQFKVGTTDIGSPVTVSGGTATTSTTTLPVGTDTLSAVFTPGPFAAYTGSTGTKSFTVTTTAPTSCTFRGTAGPTTLTGIAAGATVDISCTGAAGLTLSATQASLLGDIVVSPATDTGETDMGTSTPLTETPPTTGTTYTAAFRVPNPWPTTKNPPSDPNAVCPPSAGQFNAGVVGCVIAVFTGAGQMVTNADAILYYSTQTTSPNSPTVALPPGVVSPGQKITFSDAPGACPLDPTATSRCWWGDAVGTSSTSGGSVSVDLDGKAVPGATATISGPGAKGAETWNLTTLSPDALKGSLTLPTSLSSGQHTLTVTEHNSTEFPGNGTGPSPGSVLTASVAFDVSGQGYWLACANGAVFAAGNAPVLPGTHVPATDPVVGIASTATGKGFWLVTANGSVFASGDARSHGDLPALGVKVSDIVAIAPTGDGGGYWMIGRDGGEFAFGDAKYHGSLPGLGIHVTNIVGMVATSDGGGYWIVGSDGGVFAFGNTHFVGSLPGLHVHVNDIRAMIPSPSRDGYVLVGSDGGAFVFGSGVHYYGSLPGEHITVNDVVGLALTPPTLGYWFAGSNGDVYPFGDALNVHPSTLIQANLPVAAIAAS